MADESSEIKMSLKIFVDVKAHKVVFAEAGNDFVDFIIHLLQLPILSVTKLLKDKDGMVGCFGALYKSIESLDAKYYEPNLSKNLVLKPRIAAIVPLLSLNDSPAQISFYRCNQHPNYVSDRPFSGCHLFCCSTSSVFNLTYIPTQNLKDHKVARYVNEAVTYAVTDNLEVKPMSISVIKSLTKDFDSLEEKQVEFGQHEGLALLKASLEKEAVLTNVFLEKKKIPFEHFHRGVFKMGVN